jgi:hypothetical protein
MFLQNFQHAGQAKCESGLEVVSKPQIRFKGKAQSDVPSGDEHLAEACNPPKADCKHFLVFVRCKYSLKFKALY